MSHISKGIGIEVLDKKLWRCTCCYGVSHGFDLLKAPNPFDADESVLGCPICKQTMGSTELLEVEEHEQDY